VQGVKLRVMADFGSSGIWADGNVGPFRHGMVKAADMNMPGDLRESFEQWIQEFWVARDSPDTFDSDKFNDMGRRLARALKSVIGSDTVVVYTPVEGVDRIGSDEQI